MLNDWQNIALCEEWNKEMGAIGDVPRQIFTNPIVCAIAEAITKNQEIYSGLMQSNIMSNENHSLALSRSVNCLDLGCGEGFVGRMLGINVGKYLGLDGSSYLLDYAKGKARNKNLKFEAFDFDTLANAESTDAVKNKISQYYRNENLDLIICQSIVEHIVNINESFVELIRWLKSSYKKSVFLVVFLEKKYFADLLKINPPDVDQLYLKYKVRVPKTNSYVNLNFYSNDDVEVFARKCGLNILDSLDFKEDIYRNNRKTNFDFKNNIGPFRSYIFS